MTTQKPIKVIDSKLEVDETSFRVVPTITVNNFDVEFVSSIPMYTVFFKQWEDAIHKDEENDRTNTNQ